MAKLCLRIKIEDTLGELLHMQVMKVNCFKNTSLYLFFHSCWVQFRGSRQGRQHCTYNRITSLGCTHAYLDTYKC